jgi:Leucine-rich repeat (LRR) protein
MPLHLTELDVSYNACSHPAWGMALGDWLGKTPGLTVLDLSFTGLRLEQARALVRAYSPSPGALTLVFEGVHLVRSVEDYLAPPYVPSLVLRDPHQWPELLASTSLTSLSLAQADLSAADVTALLGALHDNRTLTSLDLSRNNLGGLVIPPLKSPALTSLTVCHTNLGREGARWLADWLATSSLLTHLDAGWCFLGSQGAQHIAHALGRTSRLKTLSLGYNHLGDEGCVSIAEVIASCRGLISLSLAGNEISPIGAKHLAARLSRQAGSLTLLDLSDNPIEGSDVHLLTMLGLNTKLLDLYFDHGNSAELNGLLERNFALITATQRAVLCFLACARLRRREFSLAALHHDTVLHIARLVWASRGDPDWLGAMILAQ